MKKLMFLNLILSIFTISLLSQETTYSLTIQVNNLRDDNGLVGIDFFDENGTTIKGEYIPIKNNIATVTYNDLKKGNYGVRVYHDENKNDKMDFNWIKLPKEGFGYTGEHKFGIPKIQDMLFTLDNNKTISVSMIYIL